jgi:hypothetical protein
VVSRNSEGPWVSMSTLCEGMVMWASNGRALDRLAGAGAQQTRVLWG